MDKEIVVIEYQLSESDLMSYFFAKHVLYMIQNVLLTQKSNLYMLI